MAQVCVDQNMSITAGVLGIAAWSIPRHVFDATYTSTGDGAYTVLTTLPGKKMIDSGIQSWTNTSPLDAMILLRLQRMRRDWEVSNPNAVQIRDRYTYAIGGADPRTPDPSSVYTGASGGAMDVGAQYNGTPYIGRYWEYEDGTMVEDWLGPVSPGETFKFWYQCYLWTPPPWSNNANNNSPEHNANVRGARVQLIAFPTADSAVTG